MNVGDAFVAMCVAQVEAEHAEKRYDSLKVPDSRPVTAYATAPTFLLRITVDGHHHDTCPSLLRRFSGWFREVIESANMDEEAVSDAVQIGWDSAHTKDDTIDMLFRLLHSGEPEPTLSDKVLGYFLVDKSLCKRGYVQFVVGSNDRCPRDRFIVGVRSQDITADDIKVMTTVDDYKCWAIHSKLIQLTRNKQYLRGATFIPPNLTVNDVVAGCGVGSVMGAKYGEMQGSYNVTMCFGHRQMAGVCEDSDDD